MSLPDFFVALFGGHWSAKNIGKCSSALPATRTPGGAINSRHFTLTVMKSLFVSQAPPKKNWKLTEIPEIVLGCNNSRGRLCLAFQMI